MEEERAQLIAIINHWNSVQSDLFAITLPNEVSSYWRVNLSMLRYYASMAWFTSKGVLTRDMLY